MSRFDKLLKNFLINPESVKYRDLHKILTHFDFELISTKGSHQKYKHPNFSSDLIIPVHYNECKNFYKREIWKKVKTLIIKKS